MSADRIVALVRESPLRELLEPLPAGVALVARADPEVAYALVDGELEEQLPQLLHGLPRLRAVQALTAGVEWLAPAIPDGVALCNGSGVHDASVAEWVVASLLNVRRRLPGFWAAQTAGEWRRALAVEGRELEPSAVVETLEGASVLILGHGSIGRAVAARLAGFGVSVTGVARRARAGVETLDALPHLLPQADVVVLLLPLTAQTQGLVDARFLAQLKPGAILLNAGRGPVVRTQDLIEAARAGRVRAALDVTDPEPLPDGHPLWSTPNVLVTPHVAGATRGWEQRGYRLVREQLRRMAAGEPLLNVQGAAAPA